MEWVVWRGGPDVPRETRKAQAARRRSSRRACPTWSSSSVGGWDGSVGGVMWWRRRSSLFKPLLGLAKASVTTPREAPKATTDPKTRGRKAGKRPRRRTRRKGRPPWWGWLQRRPGARGLDKWIEPAAGHVPCRRGHCSFSSSFPPFSPFSFIQSRSTKASRAQATTPSLFTFLLSYPFRPITTLVPRLITSFSPPFHSCSP